MVTLNARLLALEHVINTAPILTMKVHGAPTPEQTAMIDRCAVTGRRLIVFYMPGDSSWLLGCGAPPWEVEHGNA